ncbi:uncharacterized protein C8Q71DRAFT_144877 [Rhodofomes roseus]|uniref:Uncharacterized protein n=1 Tax=Rhodofomes roseus TaxID=34475 RepID=A0ABQ8KAS6_9APHY|nr:uncharacterized protein C8Q71DRAFT_144877 [Rhodofomes roseus]KAH9834499.1 hypothetical protein C8Q71DRAFT_144877 [Rhodofomes roseus]
MAPARTHTSSALGTLGIDNAPCLSDLGTRPCTLLARGRGMERTCKAAIVSAIAIGSAALRWERKWSEGCTMPLAGGGACFCYFSVLIKAVSSPCCSLEVASAALSVRRQEDWDAAHLWWPSLYCGSPARDNFGGQARGANLNSHCGVNPSGRTRTVNTS